MMKIWGSFKNEKKADDFITRLKDRARGEGNFFKYKMGIDVVYNPNKSELENIKYMDKVVNKTLNSYQRGTDDAKNNMYLRKEVLKEKESRELGKDFKSFKARKNNKGEVDKKDIVPNELGSMDDDLLNQYHEYFDRYDELNMMIKSEAVENERGDLKSEIRELIRGEIKAGHSHIIAEDMMEMVDMDEEEIEKVRIAKREEKKNDKIIGFTDEEFHKEDKPPEK